MSYTDSYIESVFSIFTKDDEHDKFFRCLLKILKQIPLNMRCIDKYWRVIVENDIFDDNEWYDVIVFMLLSNGVIIPGYENSFDTIIYRK